MPNLKDLSVAQLQRAIEIKQRIETLQSQLDSIKGGGEVAVTSAVEAPAPAKRKYRMTAAHRRKLIKTLAKARAARWAKVKGAGAAKPAASKKRRKMSPAARAKIAAAARARWAKAKKAGKMTL